MKSTRLSRQLNIYDSVLKALMRKQLSAGIGDGTENITANSQEPQTQLVCSKNIVMESLRYNTHIFLSRLRSLVNSKLDQ